MHAERKIQVALHLRCAATEYRLRSERCHNLSPCGAVLERRAVACMGVLLALQVCRYKVDL